MRRILIITIFAFSLVACGKKGALLYPDMLVPAAPANTVASQIGSTVKLQFLLPETDRSGRRLLDLEGVKINKLESGSTNVQVCTSCMTEYRLFRKLYLDLLPDGTERHGNRIILLDDEVSAEKSYSYVVVPFSKGGIDGLASPQVSIQVVQPILPPILKAESFPTEIKISLVSLPPVAGSFIGYNVYRTTEQEKLPHLPVNKEPISGNDYVDIGLERNVKYHYMARSVVKLQSGNLVESPASNVVGGILKNDE
jgi:predicted small lipoprotein YifL